MSHAQDLYLINGDICIFGGSLNEIYLCDLCRFRMNRRNAHIFMVYSLLNRHNRFVGKSFIFEH